jgi:hypothetical protein
MISIHNNNQILLKEKKYAQQESKYKAQTMLSVGFPIDSELNIDVSAQTKSIEIPYDIIINDGTQGIKSVYLSVNNIVNFDLDVEVVTADDTVEEKTIPIQVDFSKIRKENDYNDELRNSFYLTELELELDFSFDVDYEKSILYATNGF